MSKHKTPPLSGQILEEATTWFVEFNEGDVGQSDRKAFIEWLKTSPEHIRAYLQVAAHWEEARALSKASAHSIDDLVALSRELTNANVIPLNGSAQIDGEQDRKSVLGVERNVRSASAPVSRSRRYFLAASVAAAMFGASIVYWLEYQRGVYTTDIGEQRSIQLGDGSTVALNARSKIRVTLHEHERDVELIEGQALFQVAKDHARPFIVHSGDTNVLAVGTQFDVYKNRSRTTVTVVEGRVAVFPSSQSIAEEIPDFDARAQPATPTAKSLASRRRAQSAKAGTPSAATAVVPGTPDNQGMALAQDEILLAAGEQLTVSGESVQMAANADVAAATAWMQKQIVLNSTPLSDVVDEFESVQQPSARDYGPGIADIKISGEFSSSNPDSLLKGLDALHQFNIREMPGRIEISSK